MPEKIDWSKEIESTEEPKTYAVSLVRELAGLRVGGLGKRYVIKAAFPDGTFSFWWVDEDGFAGGTQLIRNIPPISHS